MKNNTSTPLPKFSKSTLPDNEASLRAFSILVPALFWEADATGTNVSVNESWGDYTGQTLAQTQNWGWLNAIHPEDRAHAEEVFTHAFTSGQGVELEQRIRSAGGEYRWFQIQQRPIHNETGQVKHWFGAAIDIHKRKIAEEALRESEENYRREAALLQATLKSMNDAVYIGDTSGITLANQAALDQLGYSTYEELNKNIGVLSKEIETTDPVSREVISPDRQVFARALNGEHAVQNVQVKHVKTGEERIVRSAASPVIVDGKIVAAVAINTDITEQWKHAAAQQEIEERQSFLLRLSDALRTLIDAAEMEDVTCRMLGQHLDVDRAYYPIINEREGYAKVERQYLRGGAASKTGIYPLEAFEWALTALRSNKPVIINNIHELNKLSKTNVAAMEAIQQISLLSMPLVKNGELVSALTLSENQPRTWKNDEVQLVRETLERMWAATERARVVATLREAELQTKVKQLEEEQQREIFRISLQTLEDERQRMAESLHNGLGQVLYGIKISLANLLQNQSETDFWKTKNYISQLLTDAIRESRRISHDLMPATLEEFGLGSAVQDICDQLHGNVRFTCAVEIQGKRLAKYLELAVYRTVQELMTNIVKHAEAKNASVDIYIDHKHIHIKVTDDGIGFEAALKDKPGIGLASIRSKIGLLNGTIQIESDSGKGTIITINIPMPAKNIHKQQ